MTKVALRLVWMANLGSRLTWRTTYFVKMELKLQRWSYLSVKLVVLLELFLLVVYQTSMVGRDLFKFLWQVTLFSTSYWSLQRGWQLMARALRIWETIALQGMLAFRAQIRIVFALCEMCNCFIWTTYSAYGVEVIGPSKRKFFGSLVGIMHSFGFILVSVMAMYFPDRQLLTIACASIFALNLFYLPFIPESPVWLLS